MKIIVTASKANPAFIGKAGKFSYAINVEGVDNSFPKANNFGTEISEMKKVGVFKQRANVSFVGAKGKPTIAAVRAWVKENKPSQFFARWTSDSSTYKDDSVQIWYK